MRSFLNLEIFENLLEKTGVWEFWLEALCRESVEVNGSMFWLVEGLLVLMPFISY